MYPTPAPTSPAAETPAPAGGEGAAGGAGAALSRSEKEAVRRRAALPAVRVGSGEDGEVSGFCKTRKSGLEGFQ